MSETYQVCEDGGCTGNAGFGEGCEFPDLPAGSRFCPFCGNELTDVGDDDED